VVRNQPSLYGNGQFRSTTIPNFSGGVRIPDEAALNPTTAGTLIAWLKVDATAPSFGPVIGKLRFDPGLLHGYVLFYQNTVGSGVQPSLSVVNNGVVTQLQSVQLLNDSGPHMLAATWNGSDAKVYYDAVEVASTGAFSAATSAAGSDLMLGRDTGDIVDTYLGGDAQSCIVFNYALSPTDITDIYSLTI
jgi:hypothetical protein